MKKNLTKKLMLSVLTLAFAVVSLGASTFAWFTTSESATVQPVSGEVVGGSGIEIAVGTADGSKMSGYYINNLPEHELKKYIYAADTVNTEYAGSFTEFNHASVLENVQTPTGPDFATATSLNFYNAAKNESAANNSYIKFRLYVKVSSGGTLTLDNVYAKNKATSIDAIKGWVPTLKFNTAAGEKAADANLKYDVVSSLRIAIINPQVGTQSESNITYAPFNGWTGKVYEQDSQFAGCESNTTGYSELGAYDYYNKRNELAPLTTKFDNVTSKTALKFNDAAADTGMTDITFTVVTDEIYTFDVYIWLEGFDAECINAIFAQQLEFGFGFKYASNS